MHNYFAPQYRQQKVSGAACLIKKPFVVAQFIVRFDDADGTRSVPTTFKSIFYISIIYAHPSVNLRTRNTLLYPSNIENPPISLPY